MTGIGFQTGGGTPPSIPLTLTWGAQALSIAGTNYLALAANETTATQWKWTSPAVAGILSLFTATLTNPVGAIAIAFDVTIGGVAQGLALNISSGSTGSVSDLTTEIVVAPSAEIRAIAVTGAVTAGVRPRFLFTWRK